MSDKLTTQKRGIFAAGYLLPYIVICMIAVTYKALGYSSSNMPRVAGWVLFIAPLLATAIGLFLIWATKIHFAEGMTWWQKSNRAFFVIFWSTLLQVALAIVIFMQVMYLYAGLAVH